MNILSNISLKTYHTFGINIYAPFLFEIENEEDIFSLQKEKIFAQNYFILGGGSNVLFVNVPQYIIRIATKGIRIFDEDDNYVWVSVKAGEIWDDFVNFCVERNYGGIENLSLIPGTTGAAPVQNIGAYGVEIKDTLESLTALNLDDFSKKIFLNEACHFAYRDSIFKHKENGKWLILETTYKLTKKKHGFAIHYGNISRMLEGKEINLKNIRQVVIEQRKAKLPDPKEIGNAGSFFKNPYIQQSKFNDLIRQYPMMPYFETGNDLYKIPAAWLIEQSGFKGKRIGNVGTHVKQPLVLVNYGNATAIEIVDFANHVIKAVKARFDIDLEIEVNIIY
jgi:UDP-N-acetylmuramate dehydrogenase